MAWSSRFPFGLIGRFRPVAMTAVGLALGMALTGCVGTGGTGGFSLPKLSQTQKTNPANTVTSSAQDVAGLDGITDETTRLILSNPKKLSGYCPQVQILDSTNVYRSFARGGEGKAQKLIHQATITQTARECTTLGAEMYIKVGTAGRVLGGPAASDTSTAMLPLRIVVKEGSDKVLYTRLHKIAVKLNPPDRSAFFAKVDENIAIPTPQEHNIVILVGFDATSGKR